ncbi:MAG: NAD(P)-binding domain-containing protein [Phycisphaerales bacterium]|nr:NAD(P)-binding domain-containing protein [Phycisphaerales bacterium]MCB9835716.1 NAD(P)-binding domain-containing protein [Phycisphaera sp.]
MSQFASTTIYFVAAAPAVAICIAVLVILRRRHELHRFEGSYRSRDEARKHGTDKARLQYPHIDLSLCVGCGACVAACPEDGVLDLLHGQAVVVHGARCVGHARCVEVCPTGAIQVTLGDVSRRNDLPVIGDDLQAVGMPGLYLAGELTGFALVRTAVQHGVSVAESVSKSRDRSRDTQTEDYAEIVDLLIIGAGPAGIACALKAKELGLRARILEQEVNIGGTVAAYPRRKMVMTQPLVLPLHGKLPKNEYQKEVLVELWQDLAKKHALDIQTGVRVDNIFSLNGIYTVETGLGQYQAYAVCLALGRRGTPRKLGVPGEDKQKVLYSLIDAESYSHSKILVIGGGDSAVEAALGLARQEGNRVTLSYRGGSFSRVKAKNQQRIESAAEADLLRVVLNSNITQIHDDRVDMRVDSSQGTVNRSFENDFVFVMIGGEPPFDLLKRSGVSFDPADMPATEIVKNKGSSLFAALIALLVCSVAIAAWVSVHAEYYSTPLRLRPGLVDHDKLRPSGTIGLSLGVLATALFLWNLSYLIRRSKKLSWLLPGSLKFWMGTHIFTGLLAFLFVLVHAGLVPRRTVGGHAAIALTIVIVSGLIGRYLYAFVPRAANGKEMDLEQLKSRLAVLSGEWDRHGRGFGSHVREQIEHIVDGTRWKGGLVSRIRHLVGGQIRLRKTIHAIRAEARVEDIGREEAIEVEVLAKAAYRMSVQIAHFEEIRAILASWRYLHRWLALLMVLLVVAHIITAVRYADLQWPFLAEGSR